MKKNNKGFSLVELIVVIAIMAILAAIAIPTFAHFITKANVANDEELMNNINYIFKAACLENGVDVSEVKSAAISYSENADTAMAIGSVVLNDGDTELADKIKTSFTLHFADMAKEKFKSKEYKAVTMIYFKNGKFDITNTGALSFTYGDAQITVNSSDITALNGSTFGKMGMGSLLNQLNDVTILASGMTDTDALQSVLGSAGFRKSAAAALNVDESQLEAEVARLAQQMVDNDETNTLTLDEAKDRVYANAAVLYSAQQTAKMPQTDINNFLNDPSKETILENMENDPGLGLAQASLICGLYTSYIQTDAYKAAHPGEPTPTVDAFTVLNALETDDAFKAYLKGEGKGADDLNGYLASLNMINGSTSNPGAVSDLMVNGFNDPNLIKGMDDLTKQN